MAGPPCGFWELRLYWIRVSLLRRRCSKSERGIFTIMSADVRQRARMNMTSGPMLGNIFLFALPLAASGVLQLLFNAADQVVVGRFAGAAALAAVGSNAAIINMLVNFFIGFSVGANVATSRYYGSRDYDGVQKTVHTAMLLSVICGSVLAVVGILAARPLLTAMSTPADVLDMAVLYLRIYFGGMPITMIYNFGAALLRSVGDTRRPLYCLTASGLVNVVLNLIFVIVFDMSVAGVALATVISQGIAAFMVVCILLREQGPLHLDMRLLRLSPEPLRLIFAVGLPTGVQSIVFNVANVVVQSTINSFGSAAMAGAAAAHSIEGFVYCIMDSFAQTCVTFTSQNLGAGKLDRVDRAALLCNLCAFGFGLVLGVSVALNSSIFLNIYSSDPAVIAAGSERMMAVCATYCLCGLMDVSSDAMRGLGYSILPTLVSFGGSCLTRLAWIRFIFPLNPTIRMLYLIFPISWAITAALHWVCYTLVHPRVARRLAGCNF